MLTVKEKGILLKIIKHCKRVEKKAKGFDRESFEEDEDAIEVVCFNLFQIGELAKKLSNDFIMKYNKVPWRQIKGLRDQIVHGYETLDMDIIWYTVTEDVKPLKDYCDKIINEDA